MTGCSDRRLVGLVVVVTRCEARDGPLTRLLRRHGAEVLHWQAVRIEPPADPAPLAAAIARLDAFDWIVFTSQRAVEALIKDHPERPSRTQIAAVGEATSRALTAAGWPVDVTPTGGGADALVAALARREIAGANVLFPSSNRARATVRDGLTRLGANVDQIEAYRTEFARLDAEACRRRLIRGEIAAITFTSPSGVSGLRSALGDALFDAAVSETTVVAIGQTTARALLDAGGPAPLVPPTPTLEAMVEALVGAIALDRGQHDVSGTASP